MKKRLLSFFLAVCMILSLLPVSVIAEEAATTSGTCGENLTWTLEDGTLTISGTGAMSDYSTSSGHTSAPWGDYCETITSAVIENGVTSIGDYAFYGCTNLASVTIPEGMVSIGDSAFEGCTNLASVTIPGSVASIGDDAFFECSSLESIYIPQNVVNIGVCSFAICTSLKSIDVSEDNTAYCSENGVLFNKDKSILHTYPAGKAGDAYTIPNGVNTINAAAFGFCTNLKSITIPVSVTEIQEAAFYESGLTDIYYEGTTEQWAAICTSSFEYWFGESTSSVIIHCSDRETPYGITWSIKDGVLTVSGLGAMPYYKNYTYTPWYSEIKNITSVVIENGVTSIGRCAFTNCENLKSVTIPSSVKTIEFIAFSDCPNLESITIPDGVTSIGEEVFTRCTSLKTVRIPVSMTSIGKNAFYYCIALTDVYYAGTVEQWKSITSENDDYSLDVATIHCSDGDIFPNGSCGDDLTWTLQKGKLVISGEGAMSDYEYSNSATNSPWSTYRTSITDVIIENGVSSIGNYAFYDCTNLVNAELPSSITSIGEEAFGGCDSLESVTIPNTVKSIDFNAFYGISALADVYYSGTIEQWEEFCTNIDKEPLKHAVIHCSDGDIQPPAYCGENVTWVLENGTLTISGSGYMADYDGGENLPPWTDEASTITSIIIKNGVTGIGDFAFICLQNLEEITIPDSVNHIGVNSLARCEKLTKIHLPSGLTTISDYAFAGCMALEEIDIPSSVKSIGKYAFGSCESIKEITIPDGITSINEGLFYGCVSLAAVTIPASITTIGAGAFVDCSALTDIYYGGSKEQWKAVTVGDNNDCLSNAHVHYAVYPNGTCGENLTWKLIDDTLTISGTGSMHNYSRVFSSPWSNESGQIQKVVIEEGVSSIGDWAFSYLSNLTDVSISDTVTDIGDNAFCACYALETIDLPDSVENIGADAFSLCNHMTAINVGVNNAKYSSHNGVLFDKNVTELIVFPLAKSGYYDIPDGVTKINKDAFSNCRYIERISIPAGITTIEEGLLADCDRLDYAYIPDSITKIGANAFSSNLDTIFYGGTREQWDSIEIDDENAAITNAEIRCEVFPKANTCGERVMWVYENGTLTISGTGEIEDCIEWQPWSSKAALIKKVVIENGVTAIGGHAFSGFENLEEVVIPDSVTRIDESAFEGCSSLKDVYYNGISEQWDAIVIDSSNNEYLESATKHFREVNFCGDSLTWTLENGTLTISGTGKMYDYDSGQNKTPWVDEASAITNVVIGDGVTHIGEHAFEGCEKVIGINIPSSVKSIGKCAFASCESLKELTIPDGVESIEERLLGACTSLTKITIPASVTRIGQSAFIGCELLEKIDLPSSVKIIEDGAFALCTSLEEITIPDGVEVIEEGILSGCSGLKTLTIHAGVTAMNVYTLQCCSGLTEVNYSGTKEQWKALSADMDNEYRDRIVIHCSDGDIPKLAYCGEKVTWTLENGTLTISGTGEMFDYDSGQNKAPWVDDASKITNVMIDDGVTSIGEYAFLNCKSLETITIPGSVTSVGFCAFENCTSLTDITYTGTIEQFRNMSFGEYNNGLRSKVIHCTDGDITYGISWTLEDGVLTVSGMGGMEPYDEGKAPWNDERDSIKSIVIKDGVTSINCNAFYSCRNVTDVTIADSVTVIERGAFSYCESLKSLNISVNVTDVCDAFGGCTNLTDIYYGGTAAQWENALWDSPRSVKCITIHCTDKDILPGGTCGDNVTWTLQNNTLTISGAGDIEDYLGYSYTPWYSKSKVITSVVIDSGVTGIGTYAFSYFFSLQSISIPKSVTKIGGHAFEYCQELNDVVIPDGVTAIEESTFEHCYRLESITIPAGVTSIGEYAFYGCESLTKIQFGGTIAQWEALLGNADSSALRNACVYCSDGKITPHGTCGTNLTWELDDGVLTISGTGVMENYWQDDEGAPWSEYSGNIKSIVIENGVTSIGNNAFANCYNVTAITIPDSVNTIGSYAFDSCSKLKQITIPGGVQEIKTGTFRYCTGLENIVIPDGVEVIDEYAFSNCTSLKSVNIPAAVTELYTSAFDHCDSLSGIDVDENNSYFSSVDGVLFSKSKSTLLCCPSGMETDSYQIPDYVTSLAGGAFKYCSGLTSITVPDSVRSMGGYAFAGCKNIKEITLPGEIDEISDGMFWGCESLMSIVVPDGVQRIGDSAFYQCYALSSVSIPDSVQSIGWDAFYYCGSLTSIELPSGLESINDSTFSHCGALESITIPNTVKSICERAFSNCSALKDIYFNGSADEWLGIEVSEYNDRLRSATVHCNDRNVTPEEFEVTWTLENGVLTISGKWEIKNYDDGEAPWCSDAESITSVVVKDGVKRVGNNAFYGCSNLESVTLGDSVKSIGDYAFGGCSNLKTITIPAGLTSISYSAFGGCYALTTVNYAGTLKQWNRIDFYNDDGGLSYATIHCSDGNIIPTGSCGDNASWRLIDGTLVISGTGGMDGVYADAPWRNFRAVTNVVIEKGITKIGDCAFGSALETVYISASVTTIGESAFSNCDALKKVYYEGTAEQWKQIVISESNDCLENASIEYGAHVHCHTATVTEPTCIDAGYTTHTCTCGDSYVDSYTDALGHSYEDGVCTRCGMKPSGSGTCGENATWKLEDGTLTISGTGNMEDIDRADAQPWRDVRDAVISVVIEDGITNISSFAFEYFSSLKSITISGTVTSIGDYVFDDCPKLESITVDESGETYCSENGVMFNKGKTMILVYPAGKQESEYQIPESVQVIGDRAFEGCSNLVSVSIPDGVTDIGYCTFSGCTRLISVNIPKSVTSISAYVFRSCESLTDIVIPDGVTSIGYYSFAYNPNLSSVIIPESVTYIDEGAFGGDDGLSDVYYKGSTEQWAQIAVEQENDCLINANVHYNYGHTHSYTEVVTAPTCTERGYTTHTCECGDSYSDSYTGALGHDYGEWTQTKAPTCTEKGEEARHCSRCDSSETNEIAPTGHKLVHHDGKAVTCTEKGWEAYDTCENCDYTTYKEISATGHNYMAVVTEPTCTEKGFTTHTCTACGYSCNDSYTDALGHSYEDGKCTRCGAIDPSTVEIHAGCITVSSEKGRAGEEVTVSVSIGDNPGITAMKLGIEYDKSKLQLVGFEDAGLEGWYVAENAVWLNGCDSTFNGVMLKLKFKILENCGNGDTEVTVSYTTGDICNYNEERVCPDVKGGKVTVHSAIPGDITGDGVVNTLDLLRLQKYLSGEDVQIVGNADINGDGVVDALDLLVLKKYLAGEDIQIR